MSIDFATLQGLTIPEGVVTQIADAAGNVLWSASKPVILEVAKVTSNTYAAETTYSNEEFILLDIYPKTNGTVSVTYGGLTKTITDTSGAEEPNAQQVFFGTFNGVSDSVTTPDSGTLTIKGDYYAFAKGVFSKSKYADGYFYPRSINDFGLSTKIPDDAFNAIGAVQDNTPNQASMKLSRSIKSIGKFAFTHWISLESVSIPDSVESIGYNPWSSLNKNNILTVSSENKAYKIDGNCLIEINTKKLISGFLDSIIPDYITNISGSAFASCAGLTSVTIPASVTSISGSAFNACTGLTSVTIPASVTSIGKLAFNACTGLTSVTFANTSGWYVTETEGGDASTGTAVDVSDTANNVTLITDTYKSYYWYRS